MFARNRLKSFGLSLLFIVLSVQSTVAQETHFVVGEQRLTVEGDLAGFNLSIDNKKIADGLDIAVLTLSHAEATTPPKLLLKWSLPSTDISGIWTPAYNESHILKADWDDSKLESMLTRNAPVFTLFGFDDVNRLTVAVADAVNPVNLAAKIREEDAQIYASIELFSEKHKKVNQYRTEIRFDRRAIPFYSSLLDVSNWWASMAAYTPTKVPEAATEPMYSTWYSYHQNIEHNELLEEVKLAGKMGFKSIIVDDGWQTVDSNRGYAYTGDWLPERLPEIKKFVDEVHEQGMKALLWYSLPFMGEKAAALAQFEGKFLTHHKDLQTYVLDPRFPEVREYLISHYKNAVKNWGWDGLKLDFIDQFKSNSTTVLEATDGRDYASVYEAVDRLMTDIIVALKKINPEVMIEFRQRYIGPAMRKYGNMFRATDIPNGAITNRDRIVNLRVLSGNTAVHSDMLMWHKDEKVEIAALQFLNILFSVPQISVRLADIPKPHAEMLTFYTQYWSNNKHVLLDGEFKTQGIYGKYPQISAQTKNKQITALYANEVVYLQGDSLPNLDIVNAKKSNRVVLDLSDNWGKYNVVVTDCTGKVLSKKRVSLNKGLHGFDAPVSGLLSFTKL
jgi:alpha-galactosidase